MMGLPVAASARAMMVNLDLYEKAGVAPPTTWDELYAAAQEDQGAARGRLRLRPAGQGDRDRRLLLLLALDPRRRTS